MLPRLSNAVPFRHGMELYGGYTGASTARLTQVAPFAFPAVITEGATYTRSGRHSPRSIRPLNHRPALVS
jgi:hypothetical protein